MVRLVPPSDRSFIVTVKGKAVPGMPTPMLIETTWGEAWQQHPGVWRLKEPTDPAGTVYTVVRVVRVDDHTRYIHNLDHGVRLDTCVVCQLEAAEEAAQS